ncbi:hypothetical protein ACOTEG_14340 [Achromobacter xylosoxidans]|uniref:hypothetical protein n=2 Tax=Alcaligenes xylosoxydans xylosoxydans TaxID=85698 RepID=UPI001F422D7C|nr:hypothetical protein [Achromobacter xylosoxidans]MCH1997281.1 hypothetical protein [Achromobacter xylosoxidans]
MAMGYSIAFLFSISTLLTGCIAADKLVTDLPSPGGAHHVQVLTCQGRVSPKRGEKVQVMQVSVLGANSTEKCYSDVNAMVQFFIWTRDDQLQLEWLSDTELRMWHPSFLPQSGPYDYTVLDPGRLKLVYSPKE